MTNLPKAIHPHQSDLTITHYDSFSQMIGSTPNTCTQLSERTRVSAYAILNQFIMYVDVPRQAGMPPQTLVINRH